MKNSTKAKIKMFWEENKAFILAAAGIVAVLWGGKKYIEYEQRKTDEQAKAIAQELLEKQLAEQELHERLECGAEVVMSNLSVSEGCFPEMMLNDIPLDNMDAFAEEMKCRIKEAGLEEAGWIKDANKARLSAWIIVQGDADEEEDA